MKKRVVKKHRGKPWLQSVLDRLEQLAHVESMEQAGDQSLRCMLDTNNQLLRDLIVGMLQLSETQNAIAKHLGCRKNTRCI